MSMPPGAMIPRPRTVDDIDRDLQVHTWIREQAISRLRMDDAAREQARIDQLLDERHNASA